MAGLQISLRVSAHVLQEAGTDLEEQLSEQDGIEGVLYILCSALAEMDAVSFAITGLHHSWPVDAIYDLPVLLEQLPGLLRKLESCRHTTALLDLYEQGIEKKIVFVRAGRTVNVYVHDEDDAHPAPAVMPATDLIDALRCTLQEFTTKILPTFPQLRDNEIWCHWLHGAHTG